MSSGLPTGFLLIDKPTTLTSFGCIKAIKSVLRHTGRGLLPKSFRIGHAGTLDDFASGLLIVVLGREMTRQIDGFMNLDKQYTVTAKLGELTDSLDRTGVILEQQPVPALSSNDLEGAIKQLGTEYIQIPPIFSALKHEGKPMYQLARHNLIDREKLHEVAQAKQRLVKLHDVKLNSFDLPWFSFSASVSKGTYVRSLANDIAQQCNLSATTYEIRRTMVGDFKLQDAVKLEQLQTIDDIEKWLVKTQSI